MGLTIKEASEKISGDELILQMAYDLVEPSEEWYQSAMIAKSVYDSVGAKVDFDDLLPIHKTEEEREEENVKAMEAWTMAINGG